jgi:hypothetical protein
MNTTEPTSKIPSSVDWRVLGEIELTAGSNPGGNLRARLTEILIQLHLHEDFLNKVLASAQEYALRAAQNIKTSHGHIHLAILVQQKYQSLGDTWGFFRIEKMDDAEQKVPHPDHTVEFYLYLEGQ